MPESDSLTFFSNVHFKLAWRPYQEKVLDEFDRLMGDRCFHVVAAPGAGKTVLGLEAVRRIGKPALILAPSLGIRDQWIHRFSDLFSLPAGDPPISTDLTRPELLTIITYQGLHAYRRLHRTGPVFKELSAAGIKTLVLDEAHHLRREWWQTLFELKSLLPGLFIVALTATPPYDVSQVEWNRYLSLCGPIDAEISVPELVKAKNLCPHQDYIYFSMPAAVYQKNRINIRHKSNPSCLTWR